MNNSNRSSTAVEIKTISNPGLFVARGIRFQVGGG
jgi:hypothetical protein